MTDWPAILAGRARGPLPAALRSAAALAEPAYRLAIARRNHAFDTGRRPATDLGRPTISIGNLTAGGTGKTPVTLDLTRRLLARGHRPAILTRGYHGGDEADELKLALGHSVQLGINPSRSQAARQLLAQFPGVTCFVLDDAFQHRQAKRDLDLVLSDSSGTQVDRDVENDPRPVVRVCLRSSGTYRMQVRMFNGQGNFVYAQYRWPRGTSGPFGLNGLIYVRLAEVTSLLAVEGYEPDVDASPGNGRLARENATRSHNIQLEAGQCYSVLVVGGQGVNDLDVTLKRGNTDLASDGSRTAFPSVRHCATESGRHAIEVKAAAGRGEYFYQVFRRSGS